VSDKANVSQIEALERFRNHLVLFLERANIVLDEVSEEVKRTRIWLQSEQGPHLKRQMKRKAREMEMLQQELFTARLSPLKTAKTGQQMQINRKRKEIRELETTLRAVAGWLRNYDSVVETEARNVEKLRQIFDIDMKKAIQNLSESYRLLQEYQSDSSS
jgi:predicted RNase H-like nuclease (RuvC/YqgF family)